MDNRRYGYFLTNCTNCGPRYTITKTVPYDRTNTSMSVFKMCAQCTQEYNDPSNRRYHAQPISCHKCGPELKLFTNTKVIAKNNEAIELCAKLIKKGKIVAIKGLGGFHLVCDATNPKTVKKLRDRKQRPSKPFAVMFKDIDQIKIVANITKTEQELITSKEKPIVVVKKRKFHRLEKPKFRLSSFVAPNIDRIGVFLPYTPLHYLLFNQLSCPIVATSANISDEPIIRDSTELKEKLFCVYDFCLDFDREIVNACDDSVVQAINEDKIFLRLSRGYAPKYFKLPFKLKHKILALGANQKNTIALAYEDNIILSPHIGDLGSVGANEYFQRTIETFKRFYNFEPDIIVCDKHPRYETTKYAKELKVKNEKLKIIKVQHHYAHILACKAEHNLKGKVLGFAWDGTGYGDDGTIWGGEVLIADEREYERVYSFKQFQLLSADKAVKEPRLNALSLLFEIYSLEEIRLLDIPTVKAFKKDEITTLHKIWQKGKIWPKTSSVGRIFDAVASYADISHKSDYEGESGLLIESLYDAKCDESFPYEILEGKIDISNAIKEIVTIWNETRSLKEKRKLIVSKFINMLAKIILDICAKHKTFTIVLSGGVFQNKTLLQKVTSKLKEKNQTFYFQQSTPINDGSISLGQIFYAVHLNL